MDCTTSSDVPSDDGEESKMSEEEIHEAVLAAGKKAKNISLCEKCDQIVGWFFLEKKVFRRIIGRRETSLRRIICDYKIDQLKSFCKLCNFLYSIRPEAEEGNDEEHFSLIRSTAGVLFGFGSNYNDKILFYLVAGKYKEKPLSGYLIQSSAFLMRMLIRME